MKAIVTTTMGPHFEKRTLGSIIINGINYSNKTAWVGDTRPALSIDDFSIILGELIYSPITGMVGDVYFGAYFAYECDLPEDFNIDKSIFEIIRLDPRVSFDGHPFKGNGTPGQIENEN